MSLTLTPLKGIPEIELGDDIPKITLNALEGAQVSLMDGDILVIAQKIISKSEGRLIHLVDVDPSQRALDLAKTTQKDPRLVELILRESNCVLRTKPGLIIVEHRLGFVCANAGIDRSNVPQLDDEADESVLLLPEDPDRSAQTIRTHLVRSTGAEIGVLIIDSHGRAWRMGTVGVAIGLAGMPALLDLRGVPDLFGYVLKSTQIGVADELAGTASLLMGQAAEGTPIVHIRGFPYPLREAKLQELLRPHDDDLFR